MAFKAGEVVRNLPKKGFHEDRGRHHVYFYFYLDGKKTPFYTFVSHGKDNETIGDGLVKQMKGQLGLATGKQVRDLVECPMDMQQYIATLRQLGKIPTPAAKPADPPKRK
jgi:hypothetical protein